MRAATLNGSYVQRLHSAAGCGGAAGSGKGYEGSSQFALPYRLALSDLPWAGFTAVCVALTRAPYTDLPHAGFRMRTTVAHHLYTQGL